MNADDQIGAASKHLLAANGLVVGFTVGVGRTVARLQEARRLLGVAADNLDVAVALVKKGTDNADT